MDLNDTDKAYLAGLVDADGSIYIQHQKGKRYSYALRINIISANESYLRFWHQKTRLGNVYLHLSPCPEHPRGTFQWAIQGPHTKVLLEEVYDYLILKKQQAKLGIEFRDIKVSAQRNPTEQDEQLRSFYYLALKELNEAVYSQNVFEVHDCTIESEYLRFIEQYNAKASIDQPALFCLGDEQ